jgi:hypothetical protein
LAKRDKVGVGVLVEPTTSDNELVSEIANVSNRSTKASYSELAEGEQHFQWRPGLTKTLMSLFIYCHRP